jgi:hypothetical protein
MVSHGNSTRRSVAEEEAEAEAEAAVEAEAEAEAVVEAEAEALEASLSDKRCALVATHGLHTLA